MIFGGILMAIKEKVEKKPNSGFTLIELLVVIAILGILVAVLVPSYIQYVEKSREAVCRSNQSELLYMYQIEEIMVKANDSEGPQASSLSSFVEHHGSACPSDGEYFVDEETQEIHCRLHSDGGVPGGDPGESPEPTEPPAESEPPEGPGGNDYKEGSIVKFQGNFYRCLSDTTKGPPNTEFWQKVTSENTPSYTSGKSYSLGDVVTGGNNKYYICIDAEKAKTIGPPLGNNANGNEAWERIK
jgi:prepilin-type N-terminal cleavage/methylation domain-containing protein